MNFQRAVSATIAYAAYFNFPLFPEEIFHWLITSRPVSFSKIKKHLPLAISKKEVEHRLNTEKYTQEKITHTQKLVSLLKYFPFLRLVALTGSVAARNTKKNDDIDLLFVTAPHTLWLVRPFIILLISLFFERRHPQEHHNFAPNAFCPNLWLDTFSLKISPTSRSLYTAHEVLQIIPLLNRKGTYEQFIKANSWTKKYLANAYASLASKFKVIPGPDSESTSLFALAPLNHLAFLLQLLYMRSKQTSEVVHLHGAFLHTTNFSSLIDTHLKSTNNI